MRNGSRMPFVLLLVCAFACTQPLVPRDAGADGLPPGADLSCVIDITTVWVRCASLEPLVHAEEAVTVYEGWQWCNNLSRGDLVTYRYAGNDAPILKMVRAVPGDVWRLDGCHIVVNGETLTTLAADGPGEPYCISDTRRLALYTEEYPVLEERMYLLLGNQPHGSLDASRFGLVDKGDIIGLAAPKAVNG